MATPAPHHDRDGDVRVLKLGGNVGLGHVRYPTAGSATIEGADVRTQPTLVRQRIGVVPQRPNLDFALTAREILTFHGAYFGQSTKDRIRRAEASGCTSKANYKDCGSGSGRGLGRWWTWRRESRANPTRCGRWTSKAGGMMKRSGGASRSRSAMSIRAMCWSCGG